MGLISVLFGLGLALRIEFVRGIANFVCGVKIVLDLLSAPGTLLAVSVMGPFGLVLLLGRGIDLALAGFMIYLIGETDTIGVR